MHKSREDLEESFNFGKRLPNKTDSFRINLGLQLTFSMMFWGLSCMVIKTSNFKWKKKKLNSYPPEEDQRGRIPPFKSLRKE
jgi:hypothetical protein